MIDFVPTEAGISLAEVPKFYRRFGGAPANVAVGLARLGDDVGFIGKVGRDSFGDFIESYFKKEGVDVNHLYRAEEANTTLAFLSLTSARDRDFIFYRDPGADELLKPSEIDESYVSKANVLHFGSISLSRKLSREATARAVEFARKNGLLVTMDPNVRLSLWEETSRLKDLGLKFLERADIAKLSMEEVEFFTGDSDMESGTKEIANLGPKVVAVTMGEEGCFLYYDGAIRKIKGYEVDVKDTTGAGDGFMAGFIYKLFELTDGLAGANLEHLVKALKFGNATGALTATDYGAASAFPDYPEIEDFLSKA